MAWQHLFLALGLRYVTDAGVSHGRAQVLLTYRELLSCEACIHHSFVHGL